MSTNLVDKAQSVIQSLKEDNRGELKLKTNQIRNPVRCDGAHEQGEPL